jgi:hypothetical protein
MTDLWIEKTLQRLGLWNSLRGVPGLVPITLLSIALASWVLYELAVPPLFIPLAAGIVGTLLSLIGYYAGDFWDSLIFDPRYGVNGSWIERDNRPYHLLPPGADLERCRQLAAKALFEGEHSGRGVYREAESRAKGNPAQWSKIEQPLILSKFIRSLLWPFGLVAAVLIFLGLRDFSKDVRNLNLRVLGEGLLAALFALLLFIPYINLRVEHMRRLYQWAAKSHSIRNEREQSST